MSYKVLYYNFIILVCLLLAGYVYTLTKERVSNVNKPVQTPQDFLAQDFSFFYKYFYKIDTFYYESHLENPLKLSTDFMLKCLSEIYAKRLDVICHPIDAPVDAIIMIGLAEGSIRTRLLALKKAIEEYGCNFNKIHIFVNDVDHVENCQRIMTDMFSGWDRELSINFINTCTRTEVFAKGLELLKLSDEIGPHYIIIERVPERAQKYISESCTTFAGKSICLGSYVFPVKDWLEEARIHGYDAIYTNYNDLVCAWFHAEMNFYTRQMHYDMTHKKELALREGYVSKKIKQKTIYHDLEESYYFKDLSKIYINKSLIAKDQVSCFFALLRSLGSLIYAKEIYVQEGKSHYHIDQQIEVLKNSLTFLFDEKGIDLFLQKNRLHELYKTEFTLLCDDVAKQLELAPVTDSYNFYQKITVARESLLKKMVLDSIEILGTPPCRFTIMLYGSMAREEATPFSDVEFGFLIEKNDQSSKDYFEKLGAMIIYKLIDLGKTPVHTLRISSLNDDTRVNDYYFFDQIIAAGLSPDAFYYDSKLPIADEARRSCCGTPEEMGQRDFRSLERFFYGDETLFAEYKTEKNKRASYLKEQNYNNLKKQIAIFSQVVQSHSGQVNLKATLYHPFIYYLELLGGYFDLKACSSLGRIEELYATGKIVFHDMETLKDFLNQVLLLRLRVQVSNKKRYGDYDTSMHKQIDELLILKNKVNGIFKNILDAIDLGFANKIEKKV